MNAVRSHKYLAAAKGETCKFSIAGVCHHENDTVVPCHIKDDHSGRSIKASDLSTVDGCHRCHDVMDRRAKMPDGFLISDADWEFYARRGLQRTIENRFERGILVIPGPKMPMKSED